MDQHRDHPITTNVCSRGNDFYTVPDITSSHTIEADSGNYETLYSEPLQPSLFMDAAGNPGGSEDLQPYPSVY